MEYRRRKQINILFIIFLFIGLSGTGVYFRYIKQKPTCFDGIQNQGEQGVDCGGFCVSCEKLTISAIKALSVNFIKLDDGKYDLAAKIINPNPNFGLADFKYSFKIYSEEGLIKEQRGESFILPAEEKYLIEAGLIVGDEIKRVDLVIDEAKNENWKKFLKEFFPSDIYISDKQFRYLENQPNTAEASGIIKNSSGFDFETIKISVVLFDENKKIIGANKTEVKTVLAGEDRYFSALWFSPISGEVKSIEMQADTNLFADDNFIIRNGSETEKFQEY